MIERPKMWKRKLIIALCVVVVLLIASVFVDVGYSRILNNPGGCISFAFDKFAMRRADRVVLCIDENDITITDQELVKEISRELSAANRTDLCGAKRNWWIEIYNGEKLIRRMRWEDCCEYVEVYTADIGHWIWPSETKIGLVQMSDQLKEKLYTIIESNSHN